MSKTASVIRRALSCAVLSTALSTAAALAGGAAVAEPPAADGAIALELNKLEAYDKGCRAFIVVNNTSDVNYQSFKLDVVLFQSDGVIGRRFALDLAPLKPKKRTVKLFELDGQDCDKIGSFLINDVMECKTDSGAQADCLQNVTTSSLTNVQISK
ncbi:MAG TPA: hypothetical protein PKD49_05185 [Hyphomicrobium sp.]|nr:hypothetical protein [Hyphomicrobium sp.]